MKDSLDKWEKWLQMGLWHEFHAEKKAKKGNRLQMGGYPVLFFLVDLKSLCIDNTNMNEYDVYM